MYSGYFGTVRLAKLRREKPKGKKKAKKIIKKMTKVSLQKKDFHMTTKTIQTLPKNNVLKNL